MKTTKIVRKIDDALFQLQTAHSALEKHVESADAARALAEMMQPALDALFCSMEHLEDKVRKTGRSHHG